MQYLFTFITADVISLVIQAVGGGRGAAGAARGAPTQQDTNIMVSGIIFQLGAMAIFIGCGIDFAIRLVKDKPYAFRLRQMERARVKAAKAGEGELALDSNVSPEPVAAKDLMARSAELKKWRWIMIAVAISSCMILMRGGSILKGILRAVTLIS